MADFSTTLRRRSSPKFKRGASIGAFWILIGILAVQILQTYLVDGETQQSAYGNDWNDLGSFRSDINNMGIETNALVSSPLLLSEIDYPEEAVFIVSGVERDTISLPRFTGDESVIELTESDGYTNSEILAIENFVQRGGTVILMDDFGYSAQLAMQFGLDYSGHRLYDGQAYAHELDYNYVWVNSSSAYNFTTNSGSLSSVNFFILFIKVCSFIPLFSSRTALFFPLTCTTILTLSSSKNFLSTLGHL